MDGSGIPLLQTCPRGGEFRRWATEELRASLAAAAELWLKQPGVAEFLDKWSSGAREAQSDASSGWMRLEIKFAGECETMPAKLFSLFASLTSF